MEHVYRIESKSILLRPIEKKDIELVREWRNRPDVKRWFFNKRIITEAEQIKWFDRYIASSKEIVFIIEEKVTLNRPVGIIAIYNIDKSKQEAEFGRMLIGDKEATGKGIGALSTKMLCNFAFRHLNINKIYLNVYKSNYSAIASYTKAGFEFVYEYMKNKSIIHYMQIVNKEKQGYTKEINKFEIGDEI